MNHVHQLMVIAKDGVVSNKELQGKRSTLS